MRVCLFTARVRGLAEHTRTPKGSLGPAAFSAPGPAAVTLLTATHEMLPWPVLPAKGSSPTRVKEDLSRESMASSWRRRVSKGQPRCEEAGDDRFPRRSRCGEMDELAKAPAKITPADPVLPAAQRPLLCPRSWSPDACGAFLPRTLTTSSFWALCFNQNHGLYH